jgi:hypothetical protein
LGFLFPTDGKINKKTNHQANHIKDIVGRFWRI